MAAAERIRRLLPALWLGLLLTVAAIATPAAFALLERAQAGQIAARVLAQEAALALFIGAALLALERLQARKRIATGRGSQFSVEMMLALGAIFCTVAGYYALLPQIAAAKAGQPGFFSFGQLHAISSVFYAVKVVLVAVLAWRAAGPARVEA